MFGRLIRGELSVTATYWGGFFTFNLAMRLLLIGIGGWQLRQFMAGNEAAALGVSVGLMGLGVVWTLLMARAQYRAQYRDRVPTFWSWLGLVLMAFAVVTYGYAGLQILNPSLPISVTAIRQEVRIMNMNLPMEIEPGFFLSGVEFDGAVMTYQYQIDAPSGGLEGHILLPDSEIPVICRDLEGHFKGPLQAAVFEYNFTNESVERRITSVECGV